MDSDDTLCYCFHITRRKIVNYIRRTRPTRASQISDCFGAGSGCGWCIPYLTQLHQEIMGEDIVEAEDVTPEEYESMRKAYLPDNGRAGGEKAPIAGEIA